MARELKHVKVGEEFTCSHYNLLIDELNRLRRMKGAGLVDVDGMDGTSPPTIVGHAAPGNLVRVWLPTGIAAGSFGSPALKTDAILAVRSGDGFTTTGGTTIAKLWNSDTTAITGAKAGWAVPRGGGEYDLYFADC
jgi:hypothetical protein